MTVLYLYLVYTSSVYWLFSPQSLGPLLFFIHFSVDFLTACFFTLFCACFCFVGYDSDDECEEVGGMRYTRRNKGKKYAPLRKEDSLEHGASMGSVKEKSGFGSTATNQNANGRTPHSSNCSNHVNNLKHNSHSQYSSEENGSDVDPTSRGSYVQHQHGGTACFCLSQILATSGSDCIAQFPRAEAALYEIISCKKKLWHGISAK